MDYFARLILSVAAKLADRIRSLGYDVVVKVAGERRQAPQGERLPFGVAHRGAGYAR